RLCGADNASVRLLEEGGFRVIANRWGEPPGDVDASAWQRAKDVLAAGQVLTVPGDVGLARATAEGRTFYVPDARASSPLRSRSPLPGIMTDAGVRAIVHLPMLRDGVPGGALVVRSFRPGRFSPDHIRPLASFSAQAVIAIENARLFGELQQRTTELTRSVERLSALFEVGQAVGGTLDLQRVLDTVVARASDLAGADGGAIYEYDPAAGVFGLRAAYRMPEEMVAAVRERPARLGETVVGRAGAERAPVQHADLRAEGGAQGLGSDQAADARARTILERAGFRAVLAVPLL